MYMEWIIRVVGYAACIYHNPCNTDSTYSVNTSPYFKRCFRCNDAIPKELDVVIVLLGPYN